MEEKSPDVPRRFIMLLLSAGLFVNILTVIVFVLLAVIPAVALLTVPVIFFTDLLEFKIYVPHHRHQPIGH